MDKRGYAARNRISVKLRNDDLPMGESRVMFGTTEIFSLQPCGGVGSGAARSNSH